jgi:hypothetical protein
MPTDLPLQDANAGQDSAGDQSAARDRLAQRRLRDRNLCQRIGRHHRCPRADDSANAEQISAHYPLPFEEFSQARRRTIAEACYRRGRFVSRVEAAR